MDAWIYSIGTLAGDEGEPTSYIATKMLETMGFSSPEDFNNHLSSFKRGKIPRDLQLRILEIFDLFDASAPRNEEEESEAIILAMALSTYWKSQ